MGAPSGEVTLLFTDIEGSTHLWEVSPDEMAVALRRHDSILRSAIEANEGYVFKTVGDAFCAAFPTASSAVAAAVDAQRRLSGEPWPPEAVLRVRMGLHSGRCEERDCDYFGPVVNRTARIEATAHGGQTVLSEAAAALAENYLAPGWALVDLGRHRLRDLGQPERIFQLDWGDGLGSFPPLRSLNSPSLPNNLPAQVSSFVGREGAVTEVRRLVEARRLVTLAGAGGSGKTRLALQVAAEMLDGTGDGIWFVELASVVDSDGVAQAVADALGVVDQGRDVTETLLKVLAPQRLMLVLDNCEHLVNACAELVDAVIRRCPQVRVLATSREPLRITGEVTFRVPSLSLPEDDEDLASVNGSAAVMLFMERASANRADLVLDSDSAPLVVSVCRRLDGMPLAIELAAARLRSLSLRDLAERIDHRFRLLTGGNRSAVARQQTLRATVEWSYSLLDNPEQLLISRLSIFMGGFDLEAAERVCGTGPIDLFDVANLLDSLVDKSLVVAEPAGDNVRYRLLETIRQFGAERLMESTEETADALAGRHAEYFLALADEAAAQLRGPLQGIWLRRLDANRDNLLRAMEYFAVVRETEALVRCCVSPWRYWEAYAHQHKVVGYLKPVISGGQGNIEDELWCWVLLIASMFGSHVEIPMARKCGEEALELAKRSGGEQLLAFATGTFCSVLYFAGEPAAALPFGLEAVARARALHNDTELGEALLACLLCNRLLEPELAEELLTEALGCVRRSRDLYTAMLLFLNASAAQLDRGDLTSAQRSLDEVARAQDAIGISAFTVVSTLASINQGWVQLVKGDSEGARVRFEAAGRLARRTGVGAGSARLGLACAATRSDPEASARLHGQAQALVSAVGQTWRAQEARFRQESIDYLLAVLGYDAFDLLFAEGLVALVDNGSSVALEIVVQANPRLRRKSS